MTPCSGDESAGSAIGSHSVAIVVSRVSPGRERRQAVSTAEGAVVWGGIETSRRPRDRGDFTEPTRSNHPGICIRLPMMSRIPREMGMKAGAAFGVSCPWRRNAVRVRVTAVAVPPGKRGRPGAPGSASATPARLVGEIGNGPRTPGCGRTQAVKKAFGPPASLSSVVSWDFRWPAPRSDAVNNSRSAFQPDIFQESGCKA